MKIPAADTPTPPLSTPSAMPASSPPAREPLLPEQPEPEYGWRYVRETLPDGQSRLVKTPLTRYDVLHPQEGDQILHNDPHQVNCIYLYTVCKAELQSDPSAVVFQDTGVYWEDHIIDHHSPDITIIRGVKQQKDWRSFHVADEGVKPELVMEVTSPSTFSIDTVDKVKEYAQAGVPWYLIEEMDGEDGTHVIQQRLYHLREGRYEEQPADERGWHWLETVGLHAGIEEGKAQLYDRDGRRRGSYAEVATTLAEAEERAEAEAADRAAAERRAVTAEDRAAAEAAARTDAEGRISAALAARAAAEAHAVAAQEQAAAAQKQAVAAQEQAAAAQKQAVAAQKHAAAAQEQAAAAQAARTTAEERAAAEAAARSRAETEAAEAAARAQAALEAQQAMEDRMRELEAELLRLRNEKAH